MKKRFFSLLLAAMLTINPIAVSATEMSNGDEDIEVISTEIEIEEVVGTELGQETQIEETTEVAVEEKQEEPVASTEDAKTEVEAEAETEKETEVFVDDDNDEVEITEKDRPYLALGADLTDEQRQKVLALMGINPEMLEDYDVTYITNEEEHKYLGSYVEASKIGTKSLSSVVIVEREKGSGLNISTSNINYCTVGMYKNALATAGITDADIIVAGPTMISGTAALVGIFKSYQEMTGETIEENVIDAALNELIVTGELSSVLDQFSNEQIEEFIAYIKAVVAERELKDADSINEVIDEACEKYGVTLSDEYRQQIIDLLLKITSLGIDLSGLVDYAESLYNNYKNGGSSTGGIVATVVNAIANVFASIAEFFKNLFS
ncbi:MAG: DUF1002 domain-containing protein [Lachnospiraceae bacterium]|nr:DUF1002 domain-containing protein [Lachnospiraceae bacterium]